MATNSFYRTPYLTTASFAAGLLLFLLPFAEIKCSGQKLAEITGLELATGTSAKTTSNNGLDNLTSPMIRDDDNITVKSKTEKDGASYTFAVIALALGVVGLVISLLKKGRYNVLELLLGTLGAISLIVLMIQVKGDASDQIKSQTGNSNGLNLSGDISIDFTVWFYLCVLSYLSAAFFSYKQKQLIVEHEVPPVNAPQIHINNPGDQSDFPPSATGEKDLG